MYVTTSGMGFHVSSTVILASLVVLNTGFEGAIDRMMIGIEYTYSLGAAVGASDCVGTCVGAAEGEVVSGAADVGTSVGPEELGSSVGVYVVGRALGSTDGVAVVGMVDGLGDGTGVGGVGDAVVGARVGGTDMKRIGNAPVAG
jgi:hypothetical protein